MPEARAVPARQVAAKHPVTRRKPATSAPAAPVDFRVRVAEEKRQRMRARLIAATFDAYVESRPGSRPVIDDVIRHAGVSRGTFYKYFDSLEEIFCELGQQMADESITTFARIFGGVTDAGVRVAAGPLTTLCRAAMEPRRVAFTSHVDFIEYLSDKDLRGALVRRSLSEAREAGALSFESLDAALDLAVGATLEGTRRVLRTGCSDPAQLREFAIMILLALGMSRSRAGRAVDRAWKHLEAHAGDLVWWKPLPCTGDAQAASTPLPAQEAPGMRSPRRPR